MKLPSTFGKWACISAGLGCMIGGGKYIVDRTGYTNYEITKGETNKIELTRTPSNYKWTPLERTLSVGCTALGLGLFGASGTFVGDKED